MKQNFTKLSSSVLYIVLTFAFISCKSTPNLKKDEVYQILNEIIAKDSLRLYTVCWQFDNLPISNDHGFSEQDKKFIDEQKVIFKNFKIEPNKLKSYSKKKKKFDFVELDTTCNAGIINRLSFPLISADRQRVVIEITEDCHCFSGGQGSTYLYIKQNGHWKKEKDIDQWISQTNMTESSTRLAQQATLVWQKTGRQF